MANSALAASMSTDGKLDRARWAYLQGEAQQILNGITAGPNGERLIDQLGAKGGVSAQIQLAEQMMTTYQGFNEKLDYFQKSRAKIVAAILSLVIALATQR